MSTYESQVRNLEERVGGDFETYREALLDAMKEIYIASMQEGYDGYMAFRSVALKAMGGIFIPYLLWTDLRYFFSNATYRSLIFEDINEFSLSDFEEEERKKMKPLLITYFSNEKEFELDKIHTKIIDPAHPSVKEYFAKITTFVSKNKNSTDTYLEKFRILMETYPDFELLGLPITKLKEQFAS
jgi:hypothetical protein